ncbi:unnamed protein product, partial [Ceratitis capitata]
RLAINTLSTTGGMAAYLKWSGVEKSGNVEQQPGTVSDQRQQRQSFAKATVVLIRYTYISYHTY